MICTSCDHDLRDHTVLGCQHVTHYKRSMGWGEDYCECAWSHEAVQESWDMLERETIMEQRVVDMEAGMYDEHLDVV